VFLVDVSARCGDEDKLPLVRPSLHLLTDRLDDADRIAIVVYAGQSGWRSVDRPARIRRRSTPRSIASSLAAAPTVGRGSGSPIASRASSSSAGGAIV
jgi:Ca-activated chloride channel family protein